MGGRPTSFQLCTDLRIPVLQKPEEPSVKEAALRTAAAAKTGDDVEALTQSFDGLGVGNEDADEEEDADEAEDLDDAEDEAALEAWQPRIQELNRAWQALLKRIPSPEMAERLGTQFAQASDAEKKRMVWEANIFQYMDKVSVSAKQSAFIRSCHGSWISGSADACTYVFSTPVCDAGLGERGRRCRRRDLWPK